VLRIRIRWIRMFLGPHVFLSSPALLARLDTPYGIWVICYILKSNVADPDPSDRTYVFGLLDPDPSIIMQN
jgi:hypothetical protein